MEKLCNKCGNIYLATLDYFYIRRRKDCRDTIDSHCKKCRRKKGQAVYWDNPEKFKERARQEGIRLKKETLRAYGGTKCAQCGFNDIRALQLDHINNDGYQERELVMEGWGHYRKLRKKGFPNKDRYQVLCANCNWIKRAEHYEEQRNG
jgi:hypothetical protein